MPRLRSFISWAALPAAMTLTAAAPGWAQMGSAVSLEVLRPSLEGTGDLSSWLIFPSGRVAAGSRITFVFELPVATASGSGSSETSVGNPYLGFRLVSPENVTLDFGLRAPLADGDVFSGALPLLIGSLTDVDRLEAFLPDMLGVQVRATPRHVTPAGFLAEAYLGSTLLAPTEGGDTELLGDYGFRAGYGGPRAEATLGITGRIAITGDGDLGERTFHQFTVRVALETGGVRPHFLLRFPLDSDLSDIYAYVVGAGITVPLR